LVASGSTVAGMQQRDSAGFDVIGDVHGHAGKLEGLLEAMGYRRRGGAWRHSSRTAVFVGDLIDRGPRQIDSVRIVQEMVDARAAHVVMGNHEFNAIAWHTLDLTHPGEHLRVRTGSRGAKNRQQHSVFLDAVGEDSPLHDEIVEWFKTIPLWLEIDGLRVVHACWDPLAIAHLSPLVGENATLTDELIHTSAIEGHHNMATIEVLLKGPEVQLPADLAYLDKDGHERHAARYAWWRSDATSLSNGLVIPHDVTTPQGDPYPALPHTLIESETTPYTDSVPLFFGHYWRHGTLAVADTHVACVDYSAGANGPLVAYRWDGETVLADEKFISWS
jgi:hypothetical protein